MLRMDKSISKEDKMKRVEKLLKDVYLKINCSVKLPNLMQKIDFLRFTKFEKFGPTNFLAFL
jgi:hypothetical protein